MAQIDSLDALTALYPGPHERVVQKKKDRLDPGFHAVIEASPFVLLATADADGRCDVSPKGGPAGFVKALDDKRVAVPDLNGNNLIDSLRNIVANPHAALLLVLPGQDDTMRIDGRAHLSTDDDILDRFSAEIRRPTLAVVIEIDTVFSHCAKSFRRGQLWNPDSWTATDRRPILEARYAQLGLDQTFEEYVAEHECVLADHLAQDTPS